MSALPEYYTEETIVTDKFLFISYSHEEKGMVRNSVNWLIGEGVRLWYDADLHNGDNWIDIAKRMITHENCIGTIFFNSLNSYISDPVAEERRLSLEKKEQWQKEGKTYHTFVVNMGKPSTLRLVKQIFDSLPDNDSIIRHAITSEQLCVILQLFNDSCIYSYMDPDEKEAFLQPFLDDLIKRAPEVVNKTAIALEEMEKLSKNAGISFKMGRYKVGTEEIALEWQFLSYNESDGIFLLKPILEERLGFGLQEWLNGEFRSAAFTSEEREKIKGSIRLLSEKETEGISTKLMQTEHAWWLSDVNGALQLVVREDGSVYKKGSINTRVQRGVRPVIVIDMNTAKELMH